MQRLLKANNRDVPASRRTLEINPDAPLIQRLVTLATNPDNDPFIQQCALQLWANTMLLEGELPEPEAMVARVQELMEQSARSRSSIIA
jgi:molecular chaperone HtpG